MDTTATRQVIEAIKNSGNYVQILTKGEGAERDFDLLGPDDWFGVSVSGGGREKEPGTSLLAPRLHMTHLAFRAGISTWAFLRAGI